MAQEYARIFAALDGASTQEAVAQRAVTLAADNHAKLMFGHVIDSVPYEASGVDFEALCAERGLSNIKYVFVGSVSTFLIRNLRCDVLVVKQ